MTDVHCSYWLVQGPDEQMFVCFDSCRKFLSLEKVNLACPLEYGPPSPFIPKGFVCVQLEVCCLDCRCVVLQGCPYIK